MDQGILSNDTLSAYLSVHDNGASPYAYKCGRCWASSISEHLVRKVPKETSNVIHDSELHRRQGSQAEGDAVRLRAKVSLAGYLSRPEMLSDAIAEARERNIPLEQIGVQGEKAA